jgi:hypothetical protein
MKRPIRKDPSKLSEFFEYVDKLEEYCDLLEYSLRKKESTYGRKDFEGENNKAFENGGMGQ